MQDVGLPVARAPIDLGAAGYSDAGIFTRTSEPLVDDPATTIAARLEVDELRIALGELTEEQQQVVMLRFVAEQSTAEVAQALAKTENAVKQLQFRALRSLGRVLERRG